MDKKRIAIIFHEKDKGKTYKKYIVTDYAKFWVKDGFDVFYLFGTKKFIPADLAILNIDLSVVPESYIKFGQKYPIILNGDIRDIRKSSFSKLLIEKDDNYNNPVIVKTDLNSFGLPELTKRSLLEKFTARIRREVFKHNYLVFENTNEIPADLKHDPKLIIEKFIPEREDGLYCIRTYLFFGDRMTSHRLRSQDPIVKFDSCIDIQTVDPHRDVLEFREIMGFDYGKFDYVVHDGKATIFDTNKTPGTGSSRRVDIQIEKMRKEKSEGIYSFLR